MSSFSLTDSKPRLFKTSQGMSSLLRTDSVTLPDSSVTFTSWYLSTGSPSRRNLARASPITCSVLMLEDTGIVREGVDTLSFLAQTLITPVSFSLSLSPSRMAGRRPSFLTSLATG